MERFSPDIARTLRRFPFAIVLLGIATFIAIGLASETLTDNDEIFTRLAFGLFTGALFATGSQIWAERTPRHIVFRFVLIFVIPLLVVASMQLRTFEWMIPWPLLPLALLWMSISGFVEPGKPEARETLQNQFWWINHRAVSTAVLAAIGFAIIAAGLTAIERSMSLLFGISSEKLFYAYLLPFTGLFLTPLYWLSTIPRLEEFDPKELDEPDFLSRAIGFLGQFVLVPLLFAYSAILLAYAVQTLFNRALPQGTLGWMVLGYLVIGAATWLVLHPPFMREKQIVKIFHRVWFWLTIVPLVLYAIAVFTRINAYGLTLERTLLVAGGVWGVLLTLAFLTKRFADTRLIPALAAFMLLVLTLGPWNVHNIAAIDQLGRFASALDAAKWRGDNQSPNWTAQQAAQARSALNYLNRQDESPRANAMLIARGLGTEMTSSTEFDGFSVLNLPDPIVDEDGQGVFFQSEFPPKPVNLGATNIYLGDVSASVNYETSFLNFEILLSEGQLIFKRDAQEIATGSLTDWVAAQGQTGANRTITSPLLGIEGAGAKFSLLVTGLHFAPENLQQPQYITGVLYADRMPVNVKPTQ